MHQNARALIDRLLAYGVRTVVLDECHHLLDYWAVVLRYFIAQIPACEVIGLTATLPSLEDGAAYENYTALLGEVDFEVPTPAVVKEATRALPRPGVLRGAERPRARVPQEHPERLESAIAELHAQRGLPAPGSSTRCCRPIKDKDGHPLSGGGILMAATALRPGVPAVPATE